MYERNKPIRLSDWEQNVDKVYLREDIPVYMLPNTYEFPHPQSKLWNKIDEFHEKYSLTWSILMNKGDEKKVILFIINNQNEIVEMFSNFSNENKTAGLTHQKLFNFYKGDSQLTFRHEKVICELLELFFYVKYEVMEKVTENEIREMFSRNIELETSANNIMVRSLCAICVLTGFIAFHMSYEHEIPFKIQLDHLVKEFESGTVSTKIKTDCNSYFGNLLSVGCDEQERIINAYAPCIAYNDWMYEQVIILNSESKVVRRVITKALAIRVKMEELNDSLRTHGPDKMFVNLWNDIKTSTLRFVIPFFEDPVVLEYDRLINNTTDEKIRQCLGWEKDMYETGGLVSLEKYRQYQENKSIAISLLFVLFGAVGRDHYGNKPEKRKIKKDSEKISELIENIRTIIYDKVEDTEKQLFEKNIQKNKEEVPEFTYHIPFITDKEYDILGLKSTKGYQQNLDKIARAYVDILTQYTNNDINFDVFKSPNSVPKVMEQGQTKKSIPKTCTQYKEKTYSTLKEKYNECLTKEASSIKEYNDEDHKFLCFVSIALSLVNTITIYKNYN